MKKIRRTVKSQTPRRATHEDWMVSLAAKAAEARTDGGASLQLFLHRARFDERPHLTLTKRAA